VGSRSEMDMVLAPGIEPWSSSPYLVTLLTELFPLTVKHTLHRKNISNTSWAYFWDIDFYDEPFLRKF